MVSNMGHMPHGRGGGGGAEGEGSNLIIEGGAIQIILYISFLNYIFWNLIHLRQRRGMGGWGMGGGGAGASRL